MSHHLENYPRLKVKLNRRKFWKTIFEKKKTYFLPDIERSELEMNCIWQVWMTQKW